MLTIGNTEKGESEKFKIGNLVWFGNYLMLSRFGNPVKWWKFADVETGGQAAYWGLLSTDPFGPICKYHLDYYR